MAWPGSFEMRWRRRLAIAPGTASSSVAPAASNTMALTDEDPRSRARTLFTIAGQASATSKGVHPVTIRTGCRQPFRSWRHRRPHRAADGADDSTTPSGSLVGQGEPLAEEEHAHQ